MNLIKPLSAVAVAVSLLLSGCGESTSTTQGPGIGNSSDNTDSGTPTTPSQFDEKALVNNLVNNVLTPSVEQFNSYAKTQFEKIGAYCEAERTQSSNVAELKASAQDSWRAAMVSWQHVELMQMGPLLSNSKELRNKIYAWPSYTLCEVDQDVVYFEEGVINGNASLPYDIKNRTAGRRGLTAIEHLLFNDNYNHNCSIANAALTPWNSRSFEERKVARCSFATEVSKDLVDSSEELLTRWSGDSGFAAQLVNAGESTSSFKSHHDALNEISKALFYMTEEVKDMKLATPLGLGFANACGFSACPEGVESPISEHSKENVLANIEAFKRIFSGEGVDTANQLGFDDYLDAEDGSGVKNAMLAGLSDAKTSAEALPGSLKTAVGSDEAGVKVVHDDVKKVTDQLKTEFIQKLALELPQTSAGDND